MRLRQTLDNAIHNPESGRFVRFIFAGLFASAVYYCTAVSLDFCNIIPTMATNTIAYALSVAASYTSQKFWAFRDASPHGKAFPRFMASSLAGLGLNSFIVWRLLELAVPYYIGSFAAMAAVAFFSYFLQRFFVFTKVR